MTNTNKILIAALLIIVIGVMGTIAYLGMGVIEKWSVPYSFKVVTGKTIGVNADPGELAFGKIPIGHQARRELIIKNTEDRPVLIHLDAKGSGSEMVTFEKNDFILEPNQEFGVAAMATPAYLGDFGGHVTVTVKKP
jgi:hypothetical protein